MVHYPGFGASGEIWRQTTQPGHAEGHQRNSVRSGGRHPVADVAQGVSQLAERLLLFP